MENLADGVSRVQSASHKSVGVELGALATRVSLRRSLEGMSRDPGVRTEGTAPRVVLVHDYFNQRGGAEKVVRVLHQIFPGAPIYTSFVDPSQLWDGMEDADIRTSFLQSWMARSVFARRRFKWWFWLYPLAFWGMKLPPCDVVLSSSSAYAKGVRISGTRRPVHICYCHTPMRFAWNFDGYIAKETSSRALRLAARMLMPLLRWWDVRTARRVDVFIANSSAVRERIKRYYGRDALVIPPPVELPEWEPPSPESFYLVVSRLVGYKRIDLAIEGCRTAGRRLVIIGDGPDRTRLEKIAAGADVRFLGFQPTSVVRDYMRRCFALIFPGEEDFGLTPVEAHACGRPVVAFKRGGALDTVIEGINGIFFEEADKHALAQALIRAEQCQWDPHTIRRTAERFSVEAFERRIRAVIDVTYDTYG